MSQATLTHRPYVNSNLFSSHYLDERLQARSEWDCDDEAKHALKALQGLYNLEGPVVGGYNEDSLIDNWIDEVLEIFGYGTQVQVALPDERGFVDELLFVTPTVRREAATTYLKSEDTTELFERGIGIVEAKTWDAAFDVRFSEKRPYRNASHQIKHYLENTPSDIEWGILTNGRKWRLYGSKDYETQTYYEVDLPELLRTGDLEAFKYFYVFFRPTAFRRTRGTTFLDEVWSESETASQELGESLQDNVFTALRVLGRGFVEINDDLDIDPEDEEALDELKEQSLVFLYRLMFIMYAEARGLIHPESQSAQDEYDQNFSLDELRLDIHEAIGEVDENFDDEFSQYSTTMWSRLEDLFQLIDEGHENLGIPPYNGGLFNQDVHEFLTKHEVSNQCLSEVIYRLSTTQNDDGRYVLADYADLDTRHLGSVYEGLLEHKFHIAPEPYAAVSKSGGQVWMPASEVSVADAVEVVDEGGLYVVNDEGERKSTGAYYTPDYVVTYIIEETVGPLVEEIRQDLMQQGFEPGTLEYIGPFFQRVTDLRILDPAMGSGNFLTKATGYLSEQVMSEVREAETDFGMAFDEQHIRREIAKECIYGVDLNGMAVELAKLSMWLETLATDRPLAFLDHHFKQGNSLVGSDIEEIKELESDTNGDEYQYSLAEFGATREGTIERLMDIYSEFLAIENETVEDVRAMKRKYAKIEQDELRKRLAAMANVHTAERFDVSVPSGAYMRMAKALKDDKSWENVRETGWFKKAQSINRETDFFHYKLELPEVFYSDSGDERDDAGFDVIVGNPPYAQISAGMVETMTGSGPNDMYAQFILAMPEILRDNGRFSFITPTSWETGPAYDSVRQRLLTDGNLEAIINLPYDVFKDAYVDTGIFVWKKGVPPTECLVVDRSGKRIDPALALEELDFSSIPNQLWHEIGFIAMDQEWIHISESVRANSKTLGAVTQSTRGVLVTDEAIEDEEATTPILLDSFSRYESLEPDSVARWEKLKERPSEIDWFENERLLIRRLVSRSDRLLATMTSDKFVTKKDTYIFKSEKIPIPILLSIVNSQFLSWWHFNIELAASKDDFRQVTLRALRNLPLPDQLDNSDCDVSEVNFGTKFKQDLQSELSLLEIRETTGVADEQILCYYAQLIIEFKQRRAEINTNLLDYISPYSNGSRLTELGVYQPFEGIGGTELVATKEEYENLRIGTVLCKRESTSSIVVYATARYKPNGEGGHETDQWGYTETDLIPAMRLSDLSKTEADLVETFVPVATQEAGGFAEFRETATKTNSLIDRLEAITLPSLDDVAADLERYREIVDRAEKLDEQIQCIDDLIDKIVYKLYGLTDEEIEIIEQTIKSH